MFKSKKDIEIKLLQQIDKLNYALTRNNVIELVDLMGNRKEIIKRNLISGIFRGIGIGIGVTIITSIIIVILQKIIKLKIPIISAYITDIVDIVEKTKSIR